MAEKINISISKELKKKIEEKIKQTNFESISEYVTFVLEQITSENKTYGNDETYSQEEEDALKKSLKDLGYLP